MNMKCLSLLLIALVFLSGCDQSKPAAPVEPAGELPSLLSTFPDDSYLALAYLNAGASFSSDFGDFILKRFPIMQFALQAVGIEYTEDSPELAVAVGFNSRAWPNQYQALPIIAALNPAPDMAIIESILGALEHTTEEHNGTTIYRILPPQNSSGIADPFFLTMSKDQTLLLSTSSDLIERSIDASNDAVKHLAFDGTMADVLGKVDYSAIGWLVIKQSKVSQNLLKMLAPFDRCIVSLKAKKTATIDGYMEFAKADDARRTVVGHGIMLESIEENPNWFASTDEKTAIMTTLYFDIMKLFTLKQDGKMVTISAGITTDWLVEKIETIKPLLLGTMGITNDEN